VRQLAAAAQDRSDITAASALASGAMPNVWAYAHFAGDTSLTALRLALIEEALKAVVLVFLFVQGVGVDAGIAGFAIGTGFALPKLTTWPRGPTPRWRRR
jgi:hypothetical protein